MQLAARVFTHLNKHFRGSFCGRIGIRWVENSSLSACGSGTVTAFAVYFIRADVNEASYIAVQSSRLKQRVRAVDVVLGEGEAVAKAVIHMSLRLCIFQRRVYGEGVGALSGTPVLRSS